MSEMKVGVIGAGIAGLTAARAIADAGLDVVVFERGRSPGGRMATRRVGAATLDHGAQFFTARTPQFQGIVDGWLERGVVTEWCRGFQPGGDGYPRFVGTNGMNSVARDVARGLDVRCGSLVFSLHAAGQGRRPWSVKLDDASITDFHALVVTCPVPQTFSLLVSAEVQMPEQLLHTGYDRTLALLTVLDRPSAVPPPGGTQTDPTFTFIGDNLAKGISTVAAVTFHANATWSEAHWDDSYDDAEAALLELARPWLGDAVVTVSQLKRWRFATPTDIWPAAHWGPDDRSNLVVAGDAFAGPRVEGAVLSGLSAAAALLA